MTPISTPAIATALSRRRALQFFAGAPLLPLSSSLAGSLLLAGCGGGSEAAVPVTYSGVSFSSMAAPTLANAAAMATTTVGSVMSVNFSDNSAMEFKLAYQPFFVTGDWVADGKGGKILAGGYVDIHNQPIIDATVVGQERQYFSDGPDGTSLLSVPGAKVDGVKGNTVFAVVQFEYTTWSQDEKSMMYGQLPSPIGVLTLDQDPKTGNTTLTPPRFTACGSPAVPVCRRGARICRAKSTSPMRLPSPAAACSRVLAKTCTATKLAPILTTTVTCLK